jgi:moderate conductance mechanosensitive channel
VKLSQIEQAMASTAEVFWRHLSEMTPLDVAISGVSSIAIISVAIILQRLLGRALKRLAYAGVEGLASNAPDFVLAVDPARLARWTRFATTVLLTIMAIYLIGLIWDLRPELWLSKGFGARAIEMILRLSILSVIFFGAFELIGLLVQRAFERMGRRTTDARHIAQLKTIAPIVRTVAQTAIAVIGIMVALSELGVQVGPLLAGAGIVGIAVGFGAQTLVKDFITGVFLIMEDILSVGDVVQIGGFAGVVEDMTFRTVRLRDFDGTLHVFPYSEAQVIHNKTNLFSYYVFKLQVAHTANINNALTILKQVGTDIRTDITYENAITADIEVFGVDAVRDTGVQLLARIRTIPGGQWRVGRELNRRIKQAFDEAGIDMPVTQMVLVQPQATSQIIAPT